MQLVSDQGVDPGIVDDEGQLRTGQPEVEGHEDGAEPGGGEHRLEECRLVEPEEGDPVAVTNPAVLQVGGHSVDALQHLAVGPRRALEGQSPSVGCAGCPGCEPVAEAEVWVHAEKRSTGWVVLCRRAAAALPTTWSGPQLGSLLILPCGRRRVPAPDAPQDPPRDWAALSWVRPPEWRTGQRARPPGESPRLTRSLLARLIDRDHVAPSPSPAAAGSGPRAPALAGLGCGCLPRPQGQLRRPSRDPTTSPDRGIAAPSGPIVGELMHPGLDMQPSGCLILGNRAGCVSLVHLKKPAKIQRRITCQTSDIVWPSQPHSTACTRP